MVQRMKRRHSVHGARMELAKLPLDGWYHTIARRTACSLARESYSTTNLHSGPLGLFHKRSFKVHWISLREKLAFFYLETWKSGATGGGRPSTSMLCGACCN